MEPTFPNQQTPQQPTAGQGAVPMPVQGVQQPVATNPQPMQQYPQGQPYMPQAPMQQMPQQSKKSSKIVIVVIVAVLVLILAATAIFVLTKQKDDSTNKAASTISTAEEKIQAVEEKLSDLQSTAEKSAQDAWTRTGINSIHSKLEEYYNENNGYPITFDTSSDATFKGIDTNAFTDKKGKKIAIEKAAKDETAANAVPAPTEAGPYMQYVPYICNATSCQKYILRGYMASNTGSFKNPFVKESLN